MMEKPMTHINFYRGKPEPYSKEYWQQVDNPKPRRVMDRVVDTIVHILDYRRRQRLFNQEFTKLEKEQGQPITQAQERHYLP